MEFEVTVTTLCYANMKISFHIFNYILPQQSKHGGITVKRGYFNTNNNNCIGILCI